MRRCDDFRSWLVFMVISVPLFECLLALFIYWRLDLINGLLGLGLDHGLWLGSWRRYLSSLFLVVPPIPLIESRLAL